MKTFHLAAICGLAAVALAACSGCHTIGSGPQSVVSPKQAYSVEAGTGEVLLGVSAAATSGRLHGPLAATVAADVTTADTVLVGLRKAYDDNDWIGVAADVLSLAPAITSIVQAQNPHAQIVSITDLASALAFFNASAQAYGNAKVVLASTDDAFVKSALASTRAANDQAFIRVGAQLTAAAAH